MAGRPLTRERRAARALEQRKATVETKQGALPVMGRPSDIRAAQKRMERLERLPHPNTRTPEAEETVMLALQAGASLPSAAAYANVAPSTLENWLAADPDFATRVARAREEGVIACLTIIRSAAQGAPALGDWQAAIAWLKLVRPAEYAQPKVYVQQAVSVDTDAVRARVIQAIELEIPDDDTRFRIGLRLAEGSFGGGGEEAGGGALAGPGDGGQPADAGDARGLLPPGEPIQVG